VDTICQDENARQKRLQEGLRLLVAQQRLQNAYSWEVELEGKLSLVEQAGITNRVRFNQVISLVVLKAALTKLISTGAISSVKLIKMAVRRSKLTVNH